MSENKQRPAALFIGIALALLFLIIAIVTLIIAREQRWGLERLIIFELALLSGLLLSLLFAKFFEAILLWIASMRATQWLFRYDAQKGARTSKEVAESSLALPDAIKDRHGARRGWPYRDRWVLVAGDEPLVKRLAPGLTDTGYAITGDAVLLYAKQTGSTLDTAWLEQIRRLRRRRPVDAIVTVTRNRNSASSPFDTEELSQRLARHARALRWAAPAYLLNVTDFGTEPSGSDEVIGFTWSSARTRAEEVSSSLQRLAYNLADAGVVRLAADHADRYPAAYYGPVYTGTKKLDKFTGWDDLIAASTATEDEKAIVIAMSSNEGNMDAVQAWDWQTFSAGAMQKTVTPEGYGELPQQIAEFKNENPSLFEEIFGQCGWSIEREDGPRIYYSSSDTENRKITGQELYEFIKKGFQETDSGFPKESKPLASIAHAMINPEYQKKQVLDFIGRLHTAIAKKPSGYSHSASDFFVSRLGRALVLDHDVNAPGNVSSDLGTSINTLRGRHPGLGADPAQWGDNRSQYETELIQIYGPSRHMNSGAERYNQLSGLL